MENALVCVITAAILFSHVSTAEAVSDSGSSAAVAFKTMRHEECQVIVMAWLQHDFNPKVDSDRAALRVEWGSLDAALASAGCHPRGDLRTELWRVLDNGSGDTGPTGEGSTTDKDFGTQQYFAKFRRCQHLSPDHFSHHETRSHEVGRPYDEFHHVVERNYVIRLCPCPSRNDSARCECEDLALCSAIIEAGGSLDNVFPWCRQQQRPLHRGNGSGANDNYGEWNEGHVAAVVGQNKNEIRLEAELPAPKVDCRSASLSGTLVSCTPIIPEYDRVKVVFHRLHDDKTESCSNHTAVHNADVANVFYSDLARKNLTHGNFQLEVFNLTADANYCVTVELDGHPYCHPPLIVGNIGHELYIQPPVCQRQNVETVLRTSKECSSASTYVMGFKGSLSDGWMIALIVSAACAAIGIVIAMITCSSDTLKMHGKSKSRGGVPSNLFLAEPNAKSDVDIENKIDASSESTVNIFLFSLSDNPSSEEKNAVLREWLRSLGTVNEVFDLSDPERQEDILSLQEEWVTTLMERPNLRVVAVTTMRSRHRCGASPLTSPAATHLSRATFSRTDATTASGEEWRRLLHEGKIGDEGEFDTDLDALAELRAFALRHVSAHLRGQYGRLMLVRHGVGDKPESGGENCDFEDLTPLRQPIVLPKQADELARWLMPPSEPTENYDFFKNTYEDMITKSKSSNSDIVAI